MSTSEQTLPMPAPAPYTTVDVGCGAGFHTYITDCKGRKIGVVWGPVAEKVWTAALFAASPKLLAALRAMVDRWEPDCSGQDRIMWESACEAIQEAEGIAQSASVDK